MAITYHSGRRISGTSKEDGLISHLKFNDNLTDSVGNSNGTVTGTTTYVTGKIDKAFSFNGSSYAKLANEGNFDFEHTDPFSMSMWVYVTNALSNVCLLGKGTTYFSQNGFYFICYNVGGGNQRFRWQIISGGSNYEALGTTNVTGNTLYHFACTYDGSSNKNGLKIYMNGSLDSTGSANAITGTMKNNEQLTVGSNSNGQDPAQFWCDDFRMYNKTLSTDEISEIYNAGLGTESRFRLLDQPTNIQSGSRYEETDTRKIYYRDDVDFKELDGANATNYRSDSWYEQLSGETP